MTELQCEKFIYPLPRFCGLGRSPGGAEAAAQAEGVSAQSCAQVIIADAPPSDPLSLWLQRPTSTRKRVEEKIHADMMER